LVECCRTPEVPPVNQPSQPRLEVIENNLPKGTQSRPPGTQSLGSSSGINECEQGDLQIP
jgi:hypothetical protein